MTSKLQKMVKVHSKATSTPIEIERIIDYIKGAESGATIIFTAGVHGNEPSGVFALKEVFENIKSKKIAFHGTCYAIAGNLSALSAGVRYHKEDLNRIWTSKRMEALKSTNIEGLKEEQSEQYEMLTLIQEILETESGPFYFIDLHTTSGKTKPFTTINDTILNRKFTQQFPVPLLLGIEEYLDGTFLNYVNQLGYLALGFESGQHDETASITNHVAFIYLALFFSGSINKNDLEYEKYYNLLYSTSRNLPETFEIIFHYKISEKEEFKMMSGYFNFQSIKYGQPLAYSNSRIVNAPLAGNVFMPLYQHKGEDGFFIINPVKKIFLRLSTILRKIKLDYLLPILPGISWLSEEKAALKVDLKIAKFLAKQFFHLLGYRSKNLGQTHLIIYNREIFSKEIEYRKQQWY